jgi:hypothetical protein
MKFLSHFDKLCSKILILRYGSPSPPVKSNALFSMAVVAKYIGICVSEAYAVESKYFRSLNAAPYFKSAITKQ